MELIRGKREKFIPRDPISAYTHFIGFLSVIPIFLYFLEQIIDGKKQISFLVFSISLLLLYGASTLYHTLHVSAEKIAVLRKIDHMMIFVLIAGTYTPICVNILAGRRGTFLLLAIWGIAFAGIFLKMFWMNLPRWISTFVYLVMGWLSLTAIFPLFDAVGRGGIGLLLGGGISYSVGALIYALKKSNLAVLKSFGFHEIFHIFVMLGTVFHVLFMFLYVK